MSRPAPQNRDDLNAVVVAAARRCFARLGVHRTRMEDVAAEAGIVRTSVYRYVSNRDELVERALLARAQEFSVNLRSGTDLDAEDLRKEFVDLVVRSIRMGQQDEEFTYLIEALPRRFGSFVTGPGGAMHQLVFETFAPLIERARERGQVREDASDHDLVEWIQGIITLFAPRDDLSDFEERRRIRTFLLPSIFLPA